MKNVKAQVCRNEVSLDLIPIHCQDCLHDNEDRSKARKSLGADKMSG
jgi:hypothetical protein